MSTDKELPLYQCHKKVRAVKLAGVIMPEPNPQVGRCILVPADPQYANIFVTPHWVTKHKPHSGGYFVRYDDGYESYSPAEAFESGYALAEG